MFSKNILSNKKNEKTFQFDSEPTKKTFPMGKLIYLLILYSFLFLVIRWGYIYFFKVQGYGELLTEIYTISTKDHHKINKIHVKENQTIKKNGLLVSLNSDQQNAEIDRIKDLIFHEELKKQTELKNNHQRLKLLNDEYKKINTESSISVILKKDIKALNDRIRKIEQEHNNLIQKLNKELLYTKTQLNESLIRSPVAGTILNIQKDEGEIVKTGETILEIMDPKTYYIQAYFKQKHIKHIKKGAKVICSFENKHKVTGTISFIFDESLILPSQFKRQYGVIKKFISTKIKIDNNQSFPKNIFSRVKVQLVK